MLAATVFFAKLSPFTGINKSLVAPKRSPRPPRTISICSGFVDAASDGLTVDYSSTISVFPAEACDTIGGEACMVEMCPEAKPMAPVTNIMARVSLEEVEREYMEYDDPKTVFPGEACDDLGGEFCEPEYQKGVFLEKTPST